MSDTEISKQEVEDASAVPQGEPQTKEDAIEQQPEETVPAPESGDTPGDATKEESVANGTHEPEGGNKPKKSTTRTPKGSKATGKVDEESTNEYTPGDSVQVKIQGYPWWPAVVVTPDHFPAAALAARPQAKTRKDGSSAPTYAVQFLGSPEYYWSRPTDIKKLPLEDIKSFLDSGKKSSTKGLKAAYQHALMQPTLEQLMKAKTELEAQLDRSGEDEDEPMLDDEEDDRAAIEDDSEEIELDDEGKPLKKKSKSKKKSAATPSKTPKKTPSKKRKTEDTDDAPAAKKPRATPKSKAAKERSAASSPELSPEEAKKRAHELKVKNVMFLRHKLQKCLLGKDEPDEKLLEEIPGYLTKLDSVEANVDLFRETKIGKVLLRINKLDKVPRDAELGIKAHVGRLLEKWQEVMDLQKKKDDDEEGTPTAASGAGHAGTADKAQVDVDASTTSAPADSAAAAPEEEMTNETAAQETIDAGDAPATTTNGHGQDDAVPAAAEETAATA